MANPAKIARGRRVTVGGQTGRSALALRLALVAALLIPLGAATAGAQSREFTGAIASVDAARLTVERGGDQVAFARVEGTSVGGGKSSWSELAVGDWVSVSWKFDDKPPKAYRVRVLPPKGGK